MPLWAETDPDAAAGIAVFRFWSAAVCLLQLLQLPRQIDEPVVQIHSVPLQSKCFALTRPEQQCCGPPGCPRIVVVNRDPEKVFGLFGVERLTLNGFGFGFVNDGGDVARNHALVDGI